MDNPRGSPETQWDSLADEDLVALSQTHGHRHPATTALVLRYYVRVCRRVAGQARRRGLPADEVADAQQEAMRAMLEAIDTYGARESADAAPCPFGAFLWAVLRKRWADYLRKRRRAEDHLDRSIQAPLLLQGDAPQPATSARPARRPCHDEDPALAAQGRELRERIGLKVQARGPEDRRLWELANAGLSLRRIAREAGLGYHRVKRQWQKLLTWLAEQLADWLP